MLDPTQAAVTLAKLQNPVKASFSSINDSLKETHSGLNKYTKSLDKVWPPRMASSAALTLALPQLFKDRPLPTTEQDALAAQEHLINRAIAMHLLREGQFSVAATFLSEIADRKNMDSHGASSRSTATAAGLLDIDEVPSAEIREEFAAMYYILHAIKEDRNLLPAIQWSREHREALETRGSTLEFELCRLQFVSLYHGVSQQPGPGNWQAALEYARREFQTFLPRYLREVQQLMGAMAFCPNLPGSPYATIFDTSSAWEDVAQLFTREFCSLLGLSADSPLYIACTAGAIALPTLLKLQSIMKTKRTEWTSENELPVRPLPNQTRPPLTFFRSKFRCRRPSSFILSSSARFPRSRPPTRIPQ